MAVTKASEQWVACSRVSAVTWGAATVCPPCFCLPHLEKVLGVRLSSVVEHLPSLFITLGSVTSIPHACNLSAQQNEVVAS